MLLTLGKPKGGNNCPNDLHPAGSSWPTPPGRVILADPTWPSRPSPGRVVLDNPHPAGLATTLATTEGENESEMETTSTGHGGDDLQPETDSGDDQPKISTSTTHGGDDLELEADSGDKPNKLETLTTSPSRTRELTFLRDIIPSEIWMQREKNLIDPAADQSFLLEQRARIDVFEEMSLFTM